MKEKEETPVGLHFQGKHSVRVSVLASAPNYTTQRRLMEKVWTRRFRPPSLHMLHVRCQFCVICAVRRNLQFLPVWVRLCKKSIVQRDGEAQERAQAKLERNRRWFERKISTFLVLWSVKACPADHPGRFSVFARLLIVTPPNLQNHLTLASEGYLNNQCFGSSSRNVAVGGEVREKHNPEMSVCNGDATSGRCRRTQT